MFEAPRPSSTRRSAAWRRAFDLALRPAGSLVVGFDLQSGHAQNRFYNELEDWLA